MPDINRQRVEYISFLDLETCFDKEVEKRAYPCSDVDTSSQLHARLGHVMTVGTLNVWDRDPEFVRRLKTEPICGKIRIGENSALNTLLDAIEHGRQ